MQKDLQSITMRFPILSFFTGAGLLDIGFIEAGFRIVWHNECDPKFVAGFEFAMRGLYGDREEDGVCRVQNDLPLQEVSAEAIEEQAFGKGSKPDTFGIVGGPPCPDFSSAGLHQGKEGENGFLSMLFVERILSLQPTFFVFENVPGLLRTAKHRTYLVELLELLEQTYAVDINVLNALDFGIPQDRNRVFLVGFKRKWLEIEKGVCLPLETGHWLHTLETVKMKIYSSPRLQMEQNGLPLLRWKHWFPWPQDERYYGAKLTYDWPKTVPFGSEPEKPEDIPDALMVGNYICDESHLATLPNGRDSFKPHSSKFRTIPEGDVSGKSFKRLHRWRYSPSAAYGNNEVHLHPTQPRRLTVREVMRIQSVPDNYALPETMTLSKKFKTIANGVPVKLALALAKQISAVLQNETACTP